MPKIRARRPSVAYPSVLPASSWYVPDKTGTPPEHSSASNTASGSYPPDIPYSSRVWDLRGQTWKRALPSVLAPFRLRNPNHVGSGWQFVLGGLFTSDFDPVELPWEDPEGGPDWHSQYGFVSSVPDFTVSAARFYNCGDGIDFGGDVGLSPWTIDGCEFDLMHDDAVQNDNHRAGTIRNSLVRGAQVFFSCQDSAVDGTANVVTVENCLVRLVGYYNSFNPPSYGNYSHGGFWTQWNPALTPKLIVRNCIFRADQSAPYGGPIRNSGAAGGGLAAPDSSVVLEMDNVLLINSGTWGSGKTESWEEVATGAGIKYGTTAHWDYHEALWHPKYVPDLDATP